MTTINSPELTANLETIAHNAIAFHEVYQIHSPEGDLVLMGQKEYEGLLETLELLSIPGFKAEFDEAVAGTETYSFEEVFGEKL